ncbi:MAG: DUF5357 domain-containing protein [Richelia sp.]|nr:DUF5357 domain-containing protein [Richelia sp.]
MEIIQDFFKTTFTFIKDILGGVQNLLLTKDVYSWQTLIYLSIFSWLMSYWAQGIVIKNIIAFGGWVFLISGTAWYTTDKPVLIPGTAMPLGALITGGLVSVFAFGNEQNEFNPVSFILWPTMSALITAIPEFFQGTGTNVSTQIPKLEARQKIIVLIASSMLVSCWLQVYFSVNNWVQEYPSLLKDNLNNSVLVNNFFTAENYVTNKPPRNGDIILNKLVPIIIERVDGQPWSQIERFLKNTKTTNSEVGKLGRNIINKELSYREKDFWQMAARVKSIDSKNPDIYNLDLLSIWKGPTFKVHKNPGLAGVKRYEYHFKRSCRVEPIASTAPIRSGGDNRKAVIECEGVNYFFAEPPPPQG